jgi:hypothetical protein
MTNTQSLVGGWSAYHPLTPADQEVFNVVMHDLISAKYTPQAVSTQLINGINYRFKCIVSLPPTDVVWEAIVEIYKPTNGVPYLTGIIRC